MSSVKVYTSFPCAYCIAAKRLLERHDIPYEEVSVRPASVRRWLREQTGRRTVPQIFVGEQLIGGFKELVVAASSGRLAQMVRSAK